MIFTQYFLVTLSLLSTSIYSLKSPLIKHNELNLLRSKSICNYLYSKERIAQNYKFYNDYKPEKILIGLAADSGCGKSTFMKKIIQNLGNGNNIGLLGGGFSSENGWETNTLVSDDITVICLDDYHINDRKGRQITKNTALHADENNFDLMYQQLKKLKSGYSIDKPIYNHVNGTLDAPEKIIPTDVIIVEGLHPMFDSRIRELLDFSIYLDVDDEIKTQWKIQRDNLERGHSIESIKKSILSRKSDFDTFVAPQKSYADVVISISPTNLIDELSLETLKVSMIQKLNIPNFKPVYLFDEGSDIDWTPCGKKLSCSYPGIKFRYFQDVYFDNEVSILEMDGKFDNLEEILYLENHLSNTGTKFYGELTKQMVKFKDSIGSDNGTGFFQTLLALKLREVYQDLILKSVQI